MGENEFIGRSQELLRLEELWEEEGLVTCCLWGRRRIGKSRLLEEFSKSKRTLYMQAVQSSYYENLSALAMDISAFLGYDIGELKDLSHMMAIIEDICSEEHTLVIIDELPYLLESAPQAASVIQKSLDRGFAGKDCLFIVCGSSISTMRKETEDYGRPLYGRFRESMQIGCIGLGESMQFHHMDALSSLKWYLTVGGIPQYLHDANETTYESNIMKRFLGANRSWTDAAPQMILREFKGNHIYTGTVSCIADGHVRQSEIADRLCIDRAACKRILDDLEFVGIVERRHPMAGAPRKPVYRIADPFIAFHYGILSKNLKLIDTSSSPKAAYSILRQRIDSHLGQVFELVCSKWLESRYTVTEIGSWWGKDADGEDSDIDIIAKIVDDKGIVRTFACECKCTKNPVGFTPLNTLMKRCASASVTENVVYVLFSSGGFQEELLDYAAENGVMLIDCETLMGLKPADEPI